MSLIRLRSELYIMLLESLSSGLYLVPICVQVTIYVSVGLCTCLLSSGLFLFYIFISSEGSESYILLYVH